MTDPARDRSCLPLRDQGRPAAPNYTTACIVMFGVNITWILTLIWAIWGLIVVILLGAAISRLMTWLEIRARARAAEQRANPRARIRS